MINKNTILHTSRVQWRARAAEFCAAAQTARVDAGDDGCTDGALRKRWAVKSKTSIAKLFDRNSGAAITLGDLLALPRELARDALMRAVASLEDGDGPPTRDTLDRIAIELGASMRTMLDDLADNGVVDQHARHATNLARIAGLATRGYLAAMRRGAGQ